MSEITNVPIITFPVESLIAGKELNKTSSIRYEVSKKGVFVVKKLQGEGNFIRMKVDEIPFLEEAKEEIKFLPSKIPFEFYNEIVEFFRFVMQFYDKSIEAYAVIGYDPKTFKYFLYIPEQKIAGAEVKYDIQKFFVDYPGCYIVLDAHAHPTFAASFSGQDGRDDCRDRYSAVIGNLQHLVPDYNFRFGCMGKHFKVPMEDIFENKPIGYGYKLDFAKEMDKISLINAQPVTIIPSSTGSLRYYSNFIPNRESFTGNSGFPEVSENPTREELLNAYGWSF
jgi:hypothetical protein